MSKNRIGDAAREKWIGFLSAAVERGYISQEEFTERMEAALRAVTDDDLQAAIHWNEFRESDLDDWHKEWDKRRAAGLESPRGMVLARPSRRLPVSVTNLVLMLAAAVVFAFFLIGILS